jgi:hypothetical protein
MPDVLSIVERGLKAVRYGFFCVNDQIALCLDGFCRAPAVDYTDLTEASDPDFEPAYGSFCYGTVPLLDLSTPPVSAVSPQAAEGPSGGDLAPTLSPGATNPTGHPTSGLLLAAADLIEAWQPLIYKQEKKPIWVAQFVTELRDHATPKK